MTAGEKVICVDASPSHCKCCQGMKCPLVHGNVYVVKALGITATGNAYIEVIGVNLSHHHFVFGFDPSRFRLLAEMKSEAQTINTNQTTKQHATFQTPTPTD